MPRIARTVIPGLPHHVIQRGNRRQDIFFSEADYRMYLSCLRDQSEAGHFKIIAYCLMRNHVHLVVLPLSENGLRYLGKVHQRHAFYINRKMQWTGHLWQGRFSSYPMDERYCYEAIRYVEMNPVKAGICKHPAQYRWSSARQRIGKDYDRDLKVSPAMDHGIEDWETYWQEALQKFEIAEEFADNERTMKPMGDIATLKGNV